MPGTHDVVDERAVAREQPGVLDPVHPAAGVAGEPRLDGRHLRSHGSLRLVAGTTLHTATRQRFVALSAVLVPLIALPRPIPSAPYPPLALSASVTMVMTWSWEKRWQDRRWTT